jgi:hypothetical protein
MKFTNDTNLNKEGRHMPIEHLKVKVTTLAAEAQAIRRAEVKKKHIMDFEAQRQSFRHDKNKPKPEPRNWPEPKDNAQDIYDEAEAKFWGLHRYRTNKLRKEARISHLAYAFLRGVPYHIVENQTHDVLDTFIDLHEGTDIEKERRIFDAVRRTAKKFNEMEDQVFAQKWAEWIDDAKEHILKQHPKEIAA